MPPIKAILFLAGLTIAIVVIVAELVFSISNVLIPSKFSFNAKEHHAADELSATTGILFKVSLFFIFKLQR